jgi:hypothetical protein
VKGIELPINILVVVAVAVIVLLGLVALYFTGWSPFGVSVSYESVKNEACAELVRMNCPSDPSTVTIDDFDADQSGAVGDGDDLMDLCTNYYGRSTASDCRALCGCPVTG